LRVLIARLEGVGFLIIVIDNYDSFTYNLVQYLGELGAQLPVASEIQVYRNDKIDLKQIEALQPDGVVISPGPGRPEDAGISLDVFVSLVRRCQFLGFAWVIKVLDRSLAEILSQPPC
jgi:anthranilate synthase component 2